MDPSSISPSVRQSVHQNFQSFSQLSPSSGLVVQQIKEDTQFFYFSGWTTKLGGGGFKPPEPLSKKIFFFYHFFKITRTSWNTINRKINRYLKIFFQKFQFDWIWVDISWYNKDHYISRWQDGLFMIPLYYWYIVVWYT